MLNINQNFNDSISMDELNRNSGNINISIDAQSKNKIIKRLNLLKLQIFQIYINYSKISKIEIDVKYRIIAKGAQKCVITLDPVLFNIKEEFPIRFISVNEINLSTLEDVFTEPIYNNVINFSETGIQMFSSFLNPYPKVNNGDIDLNSIYKNDKKTEKLYNNPFEVLNKINK